jgi:hypothetical protein
MTKRVNFGCLDRKYFLSVTLGGLIQAPESKYGTGFAGTGVKVSGSGGKFCDHHLSDARVFNMEFTAYTHIQ